MRLLTTLCGFLLSLLLLSGCQQQDAADDVVDWRAAITFPVSYAGTLPCANCPGIDYRLNLFADQSFFLQIDDLDREPNRFFQLGRWQLHAQNTLVLLSDQQNYRFAINDENSLTLLNQQGQSINSDDNHELRRDNFFKAIYPQLAMRGLYRSDADGSFFDECLSGQRWPVAASKEHQVLQKRYNELSQLSNEAQLISLEAALFNDDKTNINTLQIDWFTGIWPAETCGSAGLREDLLDTYWKLTRLQNQPIILSNGQQEPSLTLASGDDPQVSGSDGCNRLIGSYQLKADKLTFNKMASTMMACQDNMELAQRYQATLENVRFWRIRGQHLEFLDKDSKLLARFQSVNL